MDLQTCDKELLYVFWSDQLSYNKSLDLTQCCSDRFCSFFRPFVDSKSSLNAKIFLLFSVIFLVFLRFYFFKLFDFFVVIFLIIISFINLNLLLKNYHQNKKSFYVINFLIFFATTGFVGNYFRAVFNNYSSGEAHVFFKSPNSYTGEDMIEF
jgi:hypothetical protein